MASTQQPLIEPGQRGEPNQNGEIEMSNVCRDKQNGKVPLDWLTPPDLRVGFIRKVYGILAMQLIATVLIAAPFAFSDSVKMFAKTHPQLMFVAVAGQLGFCLAMTCGPTRWRHEFPINYALLTGFTLFEGLLVGFVCAQYTGMSVLIAIGATAALVTGLTVFALNTSHDFTGYGPYLFAGCWAMLIAGFLFMFIPYPNPLHKIYAGCVLILFAFYLVYDTQLVVGGDHRSYQLTVDDYVFGALIIYMDIIQIFLQLLELLGKRD